MLPLAWFCFRIGSFMRLIINIATRGRPDTLRETVGKTVVNMREASTELVLSIDKDDEPSCVAGYQLGQTYDCINLDIQEREDSLGAKWNRMLKYSGDVYMNQGDYTAQATPGFDTKILEAASLFPDGIGVVYGHMANLSFPHNQAATRKWCDLVGYYPEVFPYWFVDHWLDDVARMSGRISFADFGVETGHKNGTQELRDFKFWSEFFDRLRPFRHAQAISVIDALDEPSWRKEMLKRNFYLQDYRSLWVNDHVRSMALPEAQGDGGERYARLKAQAEAILHG